MEPGRELDALVAEKVMGLKLVRFGHGDRLEVVIPSYDFLPIAAYSTDIAAAWKVVEKLSADGSWGLHGQDGLGWEAELNFQIGRFLQNEDTVSMGRGETASLAICLAALRAVGVEA